MTNLMRTVVFSLLCLFSISCTNGEQTEQADKGKGYLVSGQFTQYKDIRKVTLEEITPNGLVFKDSTQIDEDGKFRLEGENALGGFYLIRFQGGRMPVYLQNGEQFSLTIDPQDEDKLKVSGSKDNESLHDIIRENNRLMKKIKDFQEKYSSPPEGDSATQALEKAYLQILDERESSLQKMALDGKPHAGGLFCALYMLPSLDQDLPTFIRKENAFYAQLEKQYAKRFQQNTTYKLLSEILLITRATAIGEPLADISLQNPEGQTISLSSLKGKVVLVDFWASWCGPCRAENPNVVAAYKKYKDKGFEIFGVSLDNDRSRWIKAIADDGLTWTHVSELKGWQSEVCRKFSVNSIPFSILLDKEGKIIATNLRGQALEDKLYEIFVK